MDPHLKTVLASCFARRCVLVGVGNVARGDDAFGPVLVRELRPKTSLDLVDAGPVPENWLGAIGRLAPSVIILADAVSLDAPPGSVHWIDPSDLDAAGVSTHAASLDLFVSFMKQSVAADTHILGVVPETVRFGEPLSAPVRSAIDDLARLISTLKPPATHPRRREQERPSDARNS